MDNTAVHFLTVFMAFFAIMNPVANASLFVGLTQDSDSSTRRLIALRSVFVAFIIVSSFAIAGREIFSIFGITLPAFRIAGGLMIGAIGYHMLQGEQSTFHTPSDDDNEKSSDAVLDMSITDKHIENAKCGSRDSEEINPSYTVSMVFEKRPPGLRRRVLLTSHIL